MSDIQEMQEKIRMLKADLDAARQDKNDGTFDNVSKGGPVNNLRPRRTLKGRKFDRLGRRAGRQQGPRQPQREGSGLESSFSLARWQGGEPG